MARIDSGRLLVGLVLIILGVLVGLERSGAIGDFNVWSLWPLIVIATGVSMLLTNRSSPIGGLIVTAVGVALLVQSLDLFSGNVWGIFGAVVMIGIGVWFILRRDEPSTEESRDRDSHRDERIYDDALSLTSVFSERHLASMSAAFRGGSITSIFAEIDLDLRQAQLAPEGAALDVTAVFAEVDILVPPGWDVRVSKTPILADIKDRTVAPTTPGTPRLHIRVTGILADVDIR